jgi:hypothetical protein
MVEEGEQVRAVLAVSLPQTLAVTVGGCERHDGVERTLETPVVFAPGAWRECQKLGAAYLLARFGLIGLGDA